MIYERANYKKLYVASRWYPGTVGLDTFIIGAMLFDRKVLPSVINKNKLIDLSNHLTATAEPQVINAELAAVFFEELDEDPNVNYWWILRKSGPISFTEEQVWEAYLQLNNEFFSTSLPKYKTAEEFRNDDPIGYDECMSAMDRILYKAAGYY